MSEPRLIVSENIGFHNKDMDGATDRLKKGKQYRNLSTVCIVPTRGVIAARVVESWMGLMSPMNNAFFRIFVSGAEVGEAYNTAIETILAHPQLQEFKYVLTLEEDNIPPPDGLLKLYESMDEFDVVGGLYWTKGEWGQPMIYGNPKEVLNFQPQVPVPETVQEWSPDKGGAAGTQDLYFFGNARRAGYRVASDNRVKVGHYDLDNDFIW